MQSATSQTISISEPVHAILHSLCRRHRVKPQLVLQAIVERFLYDACTDPTLAPIVAREARIIEQTGTLPDHEWRETPPKLPLQTNAQPRRKGGKR